MRNSRTTLSKVLGRTDIIAIGFGTMVGWSWIMMSASWVNEAGLFGALSAFIIGGIIILAIGLTYGELTAALPLAGGEFVFAYRAMGKRAAWLVGWIMSLAYLGVAAWEGIALATVIDYILPVEPTWPLWEVAGYQVNMSWSLIGMAGAIVITALNYFGVRPAVLFQVMATAALMVVVLILFFGSIAFGDTDNIGNLFTSFQGFSYVFLMVPAMLIGFDVIPQSAEEMNIRPKNIGKMVLVCILLSLIWYFILIIAISIAAPVEIRDSGTIPAADIAAYLFNGDIFSIVVLFGGIFGILTSWNGFFIGATRLIFSMGRAHVLPEIFGMVHRKYKTPCAAVLLVGTLCVLAPLLGKNALIWFMDTSSLCALFSYIFVVLSFVLLKKKEPELPRPLKVSGGIGFGMLILIVTIIYFMMYIHDNFSLQEISPEFIITVLWITAGLILIFMAKGSSGEIDEDQRELLVFGERFARKGGKREK